MKYIILQIPPPHRCSQWAKLRAVIIAYSIKADTHRNAWTNTINYWFKKTTATLDITWRHSTPNNFVLNNSRCVTGRQPRDVCAMYKQCAVCKIKAINTLTVISISTERNEKSQHSPISKFTFDYDDYNIKFNESQNKRGWFISVQSKQKPLYCIHIDVIKQNLSWRLIKKIHNVKLFNIRETKRFDNGFITVITPFTFWRTSINLTSICPNVSFVLGHVAS